MDDMNPDLQSNDRRNLLEVLSEETIVQNPVRRIELAHDLGAAILELSGRCLKGFSDVLVFLGNFGQDGNVRAVTHAVILRNSNQNRAFFGDVRALTQSQVMGHKGVDNLEIIGIGTAVATESDIVNYCTNGGMKFYLTCWSNLVEDRSSISIDKADIAAWGVGDGKAKRLELAIV